MKNEQKISTLAGILYLLGFVAGSLSVSHSIDSQDFLIQATQKKIEVESAAFFQFLYSILYMGFILTLYPILKQKSKDSALGFLTFKIIAVTLNLIGFIILILLLDLSLQFGSETNPDIQYFNNYGTLLKNGRDLINHVAMIIMSSIGGIYLYLILYQINKFPKVISLIGIMGAILTIIASLLVMFKIIEVLTSTYIILNIPLVLMELFFAFWLIFKGFKEIK